MGDKLKSAERKKEDRGQYGIKRKRKKTTSLDKNGNKIDFDQEKAKEIESYFRKK